MRRATAYFNKKRLNDAKNDIELVISKEPSNKKAIELCDEIKKALKKENDENEQVKAKGGKRLTIEETDGDESEEEQEQEVVATKKSVQIKEVEEDDEESEAEENSEKGVDSVPPKIEEAKIEAPQKVEEVKIEASRKVEEAKIEAPPKVEEKPLPQKVVDFKDKANKEYAAGQYGEAISYYSKAIDQLKKEFTEEDIKLYYGNTLSILYSNRASCKQKTGDFKDSINDCNLSLEIRGDNVKVLFKKAHVLELSEKYNDSLIEYQKIMRIDSTYKQAQEGYNRVKNLLISRGELKTATQLPTKVQPQPPVENKIKEEELNFDKLKEKGNDYFKQNNYTEALKFYTKCVELEKQNLVAYLNRAICSIKLNDGSSALNDCNFVLKHDKKNVKALYRRALANKLLGKIDESVNDLKEVIQIEPKNAIAIKDLAEIEKEKAAKTEQPPSVNKPKTKEEVKQPAKDEAIKRKPVKFENEITNNYEFLQAWNSVKLDDIGNFCQLIEKIDAQKLAKYVGSKLDDSMLSTFIKTFHRYIFDDPSEEYEQTEEVDGYNLIDRKQKLNKLDIYNYIIQLTKVQRFDIIKLFLSEENKVLLNKCLNYLSENIKTTTSFTNENILELKKLYGI